MITPELQKILNRTETGRQIVKKLLQSKTPELLGATLWSKAKKTLKKVGKYTKGLTTAAAKIAAASFGIPPSAIDALAQIDPTAKNALTKAIAQTKTARKAISKAAENAVKATTAPATTEPKKDIFKTIKEKPLLIAGIVTGAAVIVFIATKKKRK